MHDQDFGSLSEGPKPPLEVRQVDAQDRSHVGVHYRRAEAIELLDLGQNFVRCGDVHPREGGADHLGDPALVIRVQVGEEKADRQGLHALDLHGLDGALHRRLVQGGVHRPVGPDPLGNAKAKVPRDQWLDGRHAEVVPVLLQPLAHLQQVPEALSGQQAHLGALALHQRVGRDGRPVNDELSLAEQGARRETVGRCRVFKAGDDALGRVVGS